MSIEELIKSYYQTLANNTFASINVQQNVTILTVPFLGTKDKPISVCLGKIEDGYVVYANCDRIKFSSDDWRRSLETRFHILITDDGLCACNATELDFVDKLHFFIQGMFLIENQ